MNLTKALLQISKEKNRYLKSIKIKSIVQILYYNIHSGRKQNNLTKI